MNQEAALPFGISPISGIALSFVPHKIAERSADMMVKKLNRLYPRVRERLREADGKSFAFLMPDMPFSAVLVVRNGVPTLNLVKKYAPIVANVTITGTSDTLLALLEGRVDGDALFFSRKLVVSGDTEALLILRNAIDNEQVKLREVFFSLLGPFSGVAASASAPLEKLGRRFLHDMGVIYRSAMAPLQEKQQQAAQRLDAMEARLAEMEARLAKVQARILKHG